MDCQRGDNFINNQCNQTSDTQIFFCHHFPSYKARVQLSSENNLVCFTLFTSCLFHSYSLSGIRFPFHRSILSNLFCLYKFHVRLYFRFRWLFCVCANHHFPFLHFVEFVNNCVSCFCSVMFYMDMHACVSVFCVCFITHLSAGPSVECAFLVRQISVLCVTDGHILIYINLYSIRLNKTSACLSDYHSESTQNQYHILCFCCSMSKRGANKPMPMPNINGNVDY